MPAVWLPLRLSSHATAVGGGQALDGLPGGLGVHEGHRLIMSGSAAGMGAHFSAWDAAVLHQVPQGQVVVLARAHARAHTVLEDHYLVRVEAEAQVTHAHLLPLHVAVWTVFVFSSFSDLFLPFAVLP